MGVPPFGGVAFGLLSGQNSIRDVIAFPKTTTTQCALTCAPSEVDPQQLKDLSTQTHWTHHKSKTSSSFAMARKTKGRQKISMTKMQNESNLQVTFSKRRAGLFKKASELSTLCGAEVGIIVFSPGKKAFSFGHPSVDSIIDRFLTRNSGLHGVPTNATQRLVEAHRSATVRDLNAQLTHVQGLLEMERRRGHVLDQMRAAEVMASGGHRWWEGPMEQMNFAQLEQFKAALEELKAGVTKQVEKIVQVQAAKQAAAFPGPAAAAAGGGIGGFAPFSAGAGTLGGRSGINVSPFDARTSWSGGGASSSGSGLPYGYGYRGFF